MKIILLICTLYYSSFAFSQRCDEDNGIVLVDNICNPHLIKLPELKYKNGKSNYVFKANLLEIFMYPIKENHYEKKYKFTKISKESFTSAAAFKLEDQPSIEYAFPINNAVFNNEYYRKNAIHERIFEKMEELKVNIYTTVYKNPKDGSKTIIIDSIRLRD